MMCQYHNCHQPEIHNDHYGTSSTSRSSDYYPDYNYSHPQGPPHHLVFFLSILFLFVGLSWYIRYETALESLLDQLKVALLLAPVLLLLALHCLSGVDRRWVLLLPFHEEGEALHKAVGSPWRVALVLILVIVMLSYRSSFQAWWFPLIRR